MSGLYKDNNQLGDYIFSISQSTDRKKAGRYSVVLKSTIANYNYSGIVKSSQLTIDIVVYDPCKDTVLIAGSVSDLTLNVWNFDYATQTASAN